MPEKNSSGPRYIDPGYSPGQIVVAALCFALLLLIFGPRSCERKSNGQEVVTQIVSAEELARMRALLPRVNHPAYQDILDSHSTLWYTRQTMGVAYQIGLGDISANSNPVGFADAMRNVSGDFPESQKPDGQGGSANAFSHFPWSPKPGGAHRCDNVDSFKGLWLPRRDSGGRWPVVWYRYGIERLFQPDQRLNGWNWTFPAGAVLLEVLTMEHKDEYYVFEIRARVREIDKWDFDVFRPFVTAQDLAEAIMLRRRYSLTPELRRLVFHLSDGPLVKKRLKDRNRTQTAFDVSTYVDTLPPVGDDKLVGEMLDTVVFEPILGLEWRIDRDGNACFAPTTSAPDLHIVPAYYDGGFVLVNGDKCTTCHQDALKSSRRFDRGIGWYGNIRGNTGGILSFHPVEPSNLNFRGNVNWRVRPSFAADGIVERYDPEKHPNTVYRLLK